MDRKPEMVLNGYRVKCKALFRMNCSGLRLTESLKIEAEQ